MSRRDKRRGGRRRHRATPLHSLPIDERVREGFRRQSAERASQVSAFLFFTVWAVAFGFLMFRQSMRAPAGALFAQVAAALGVAAHAALWASIFAIDAWLMDGWITRPIGWLWARRDKARGRLAVPGACPCCFYNLEGLAGDVCPECGGTVPQAERRRHRRRAKGSRRGVGG